MESDTRLLEIDGLGVELLVEGILRPVIHSVDFHVREGEAVGLVGESGSGKTMTARAIMRLLPRGGRVAGEIRFDGINVGSLHGNGLRRYRSRDVAMIYQDPRVHVNPLHTIGDFLTEGVVANGQMPPKEAAEAAVSMLEDVGIADASRRMRQYPHQLSGGLLQRVVIAAALLPGPRLLLADEPTTALDVTTQEEVMAILDEQRRERGLAMLLITHDLDLAAAVTDRLAVMYAGTIVETARADRLHQQPLHPYSAGLLASRPSSTKLERMPTIPGRPISAFEAESGCVFASRCPWAVDRCRLERPALKKSGEDAEVACHRADELRGELAYEVRQTA